MSHFNLTLRAKEDLRNIWRYTRDLWGVEKADAYVADIYNRCAWLSERPSLGKLRTDIAEGYYCFPQGRHLIFYLAREKEIDIIGIPHKAMDVEQYFEEE